MHSIAPRTVAAADRPDLELSSVQRLLNGLLQVRHPACRPHVVSQIGQSPVAARKIPIKVLIASTVNAEAHQKQHEVTARSASLFAHRILGLCYACKSSDSMMNM